MNWQPIETAPKDETDVLLYVECRFGSSIQIGQWCDDPEGEGAWVSGSMSRIAPFPHYNVTHWMPLPEPPK